MNLTAPLIQTVCGASASNAALWLGPLQAACDRFEINTALRVAAFLAEVGVESAGLNAHVENLNYGAQGLADTWPSRYAVNPRAPVKVPNDLANRIARNQQAIANNCYANRNGNGPESSGDGWAFRGRGPIQITGRTNYTACAAAIGMDLVAHPELLEQPQAGALSAGWFWSVNGLNKFADGGQITAISKAINLGNPNSTSMPIGQAARLAAYGRAQKALGV
jgi:putative chitinase